MIISWIGDQILLLYNVFYYFTLNYLNQGRREHLKIEGLELEQYQSNPPILPCFKEQLPTVKPPNTAVF